MLHLTRIEGKPTPFEMCSHFQKGTLRCIDISSKSCHKSSPIFYDFSSKCIEWILQYHVLLAHANIQITIPHVCNFGIKKLWIFDISNLTPSSLSAKLYHTSLSVKWLRLFAQIVYQTMVKIWQLSLSAKSLQPTWSYYLHSKIFVANLDCNGCTFILQCAFVL